MIKFLVRFRYRQPLTVLFRRLSMRGLALRWSVPSSSRAPRSSSIEDYYTNQFLAAHQVHIRGRVLEAGGDSLMRRFGRDAHSLHVIAVPGISIPNVTLAADMTLLSELPERQFNCFICTDTLHRFVDPRAAIRGAFRMLRPGGVLLASFPTLPAAATNPEAARARDYWRFTPAAVHECLTEVFGAGQVEVHPFGNRLSATAVLAGLSYDQIGTNRLAPVEPGCEVVICAMARKAVDAADGNADATRSSEPQESAAPPRRLKKKRRPEAN